MVMISKMNYLLDTHVLLWWFTQPEKLKLKTQQIIQDESNQFFVSSASFWEMAIKQSIGKLVLPHTLLETVVAEGFKFLPIMPEEGLGVADLPLLHSDPFDRLLIIQAKLHDLIIVTNDAKIMDYPAVCIEA